MACCFCCWIVAGTVLLAAIFFLWKRRASNHPSKWPRDQVVLHEFAHIKGYELPVLSPFCLKTHTFLRMAKIPYACDFSRTLSPKGKMPWLEFEGKMLGDSAFIMEFLSEHFSINLDEGLSELQLAKAHCMRRMLEEFTALTVTWHRWCTHRFERFAQIVFAGAPRIVAFFLKKIFQPRVYKMLFAQGLGRHTPEEIAKLQLEDIRAIVVLLGDQQFMLGDRPSAIDCTAFGVLANVCLEPFDTPLRAVLEEDESFAPLLQYLERMRSRFFPDFSNLRRKTLAEDYE